MTSHESPHTEAYSGEGSTPLLSLKSIKNMSNKKVMIQLPPPQIVDTPLISLTYTRRSYKNYDQLLRLRTV